MTERYCQHCPCYVGVGPDSREPPFCTLGPTWVDIEDDHFCYTGRQIMATRASLQQAREAFEKEGETNA